MGDQSLADYNLGNEEEEQLLADDYESSSSQNVPASVGPSYGTGPDLVSPEYPGHSMDYGAQVCAVIDIGSAVDIVITSLVTTILGISQCCEKLCSQS